MKSAFHRQLLRLHTWSGLSAGLIAAFLGLTGAGFVLRPQLQALLYPRLFHVAACEHRLPLDALAARAVAAYPAGGAVDNIQLRPATTTASTAVEFGDKEMVYLDPCTGAILGRQNEYGGFFGLLDGLHRFRFMADGREFAGVGNALFLGLLLIGGLYLWWPRAGQTLRSAASFQRRLPGPARTISLHKVVGLYTCAVLLLISLTGLPLAFQPVKSLIAAAVGSPLEMPPAPHARYHPGAQRLPMQALWDRARQVYPDATWVEVHYPRQRRDAVEMELLQRGARHTEAKSYVYLDPYGGQVLRTIPYATGVPFGRKLYLYLLALHSGLVGGLPYQLVLLLACLALPVQLYSGASPYLRRKLRRPAQSTLTLRVVGKRIEARDICTFELSDPRGRALPPFSPGSHITVHVRPGLVRPYSLCNHPRETHRYLIGVLRVPASRGGSQAMHEQLREGDLIEIGAPRNHFPLASGARRHLLLAGGIGVTPILSMAEQLAETGEDFEMHYCARSAERAAFLGRLGGARFAGRIALHFSDGPPEQRFDPDATLARADADTHLYVCGPGGFMEAVLRAARRGGWPEEHIHREHFTGAGQDTSPRQPFEIRIASTGRTVHVPADQTALEALRQAGVQVQSSCAEGVCGTCMTRVLAGTPEHRDLYLNARERARNDRFLPCCSRATGGPLVLDL